ncbi:MAG: hypothetical protein WC728_15375 [Elusimicrobiota bacterium]
MPLYGYGNDTDHGNDHDNAYGNVNGTEPATTASTNIRSHCDEHGGTRHGHITSTAVLHHPLSKPKYKRETEFVKG